MTSGLIRVDGCTQACDPTRRHLSPWTGMLTHLVVWRVGGRGANPWSSRQEGNCHAGRRANDLHRRCSALAAGAASPLGSGLHSWHCSCFLQHRLDAIDGERDSAPRPAITKSGQFAASEHRRRRGWKACRGAGSTAALASRDLAFYIGRERLLWKGTISQRSRRPGSAGRPYDRRATSHTDAEVRLRQEVAKGWEE